MKKFYIYTYITIIMIIALASTGSAEDAKRTAKIIAIDGIVEVRPVGRTWVAAEVGMELNEGDVIKTAADSTAVLNLNGEGETATVDISEGSQLKIPELTGDKEKGTQKTLLDLAIGKILIRAQKLHSEEERFEVKTPTTIVGVRGTTFAVEVEALE